MASFFLSHTFYYLRVLFLDVYEGTYDPLLRVLRRCNLPRLRYIVASGILSL